MRILRIVASGVRRAASIAKGLMRELADERAYERHLAAHGSVHSRAEWRRFSNERLRAKYERAKCC